MSHAELVTPRKDWGLHASRTQGPDEKEAEIFDGLLAFAEGIEPGFSQKLKNL